MNKNTPSKKHPTLLGTKLPGGMTNCSLQILIAINPRSSHRTYCEFLI